MTQKLCMKFPHCDHITILRLVCLVATSPASTYQTPICYGGDICFKDKDSRRSCDGYLTNGYTESPNVLDWISEKNTNVLIIKVKLFYL